MRTEDAIPAAAFALLMALLVAGVVILVFAAVFRFERLRHIGRLIMSAAKGILDAIGWTGF
jgi:hypothetical protein